MAMTPEDMEKRRQKRQAQLKKKRAQQRRLRLGLAAAVVVLALCAGALYYFTQNAPKAQLGSAQNVTVHGIPTEYSRYCFSVKEM